MANTTNFGWETPDDTDLVKDGAAAMRTLGNSIDASFVDLKGGTTGQLLSKASNTDLDFTWTAAGLSASIVDAKGDLIAGTAADTVSRLAVGANGTVLTADSAEATGLKWTTPSSISGWSLLNSGGTSLSGSATVTVSGLSAKQMLILIPFAQAATASGYLQVRFNGDNGTNYSIGGTSYTSASSYSTNNLTRVGNYTGYDRVDVGGFSSNTNSYAGGTVFIDLADKTGWKYWQVTGSGQAEAGNGHSSYVAQGIWEASAAVTSISVISTAGNFTSGSVYVFGAN